MVTYIKSDLDFILAQIKLSEAHAAGTPLFGPGGLIPTYNLSWGLRTVDGTYNNPLHPEWGAADNEFPEPLGTQFRTIMVDPDGLGPTPMVPVSYTPGVDNTPGVPDGPGNSGPSDVFDPYVRTISNLIVDQTLGNPSAILTALQRAGIVAPAEQMTVTAQISAAYAPLVDEFRAISDAERANAEAQAAASASPGNTALQDAAAATAAALATAQGALDAVDDALMTLLSANGVELEGANVKITNLAPDEGLSAPFNSWFTLFGQFFDHGLDLVAKGGNGTVFIPLMPDDPLYVPGGQTNFMVLTRATLAGPGADNVLGTADDTDRPVNTTTAFVDQNQTYTSHPSHQVFLREYVLNGAGDPVATGKLIEGGNGGMATWADLKAQAADLLGIQLVDSNVGNVPLLATDPYGAFLRGPNGFPQMVTATGLVEGNPAANGGLGVLVPENAFKTGHAFLADIAHNAVPDGLADGDIEVGLNNPGFESGAYDNELLDAHYVAGDGRANENIGLIAVHHVFHSEHNRLMEHTKAVVLATGDNAFIQEWLVPGATIGDGVQDLEWNGERLFQAAKFGTEMQYQHLVFEEFARKIQPNINVFLVPDGFDVTIDPSIVAEFAHVVYRFGHSMLNESIDRFDPDFNPDHIGLIEGFLNPLQFENNGTNATVDADIAAGAIIRGMTRQVGNEIDEFVTSALRNNLLGLPLDLATINLARGRDTGVPSLNEARRQFYEATNEDSLLKPYESWVDFAGHLKHEASIINFIASYGTHSLITGQSTIQGKRDAALTLITGVSVGGLAVQADAQAFLNATGAYAGGTLGGLNNVDLWIGGLAEAIMPFGGMLGSTFNFVFEMQMEKLQSGDRFYYLQRLDGLHLFGEMENNSFAAMIMRNTDATHLPSDVFSAPGLILEVDQTKQFNDLDGDGTLESIDPEGGGILTPLVVRDDPSTPDADLNYLKYTGGDHVVLGGTEAADTLIAGIGDDTLFGDGGADRLEGGFGNDIINGGAGDDIIRDSGGDDNIKGEDGNDVIHAGPGLDLVMGGRGQDFIFLGTDMGSEVFAGEGNDFIYGNKNAERILGNEGNDWIETGTFDGAPGDNFDEIFAHDGVKGHDVFLGDGGFDEFIGEGGDDIMVGSSGRGKMAGMSGFDWATYKDNTFGVNADLSIPIIFDESPVLPENAALDEFASMEGLSGSRFNDVLAGTNDVEANRLSLALGGTTGYLGSVLDAEGIALISGLQAVLGTGVTSLAAGDIILGGDGSDVITGRMGDDIIDGDKWLDVQIGVYATTERTGTPIALHNSMTTLASAMFAGTINPGQLGIVRTIRSTADAVVDVDTAVFSDLYANYTRTLNADGTTSVAHVTVSDGLESDGTDRLRGIEKLQFADFTIDITQNSTGQPVINDTTPTEGQTLTVNTAGIADPDGLGAFNYQWQSSLDGILWSDVAGATGASFLAPDAAAQAFGPLAGHQLRVVVRFTDGGGNSELTVSEATAPLGVDWDGTGGNDTFGGLVGGVAVIGGTEGNDVVDAGGGNDTLAGNGGDDDLDGDGGNDTITGGMGDDLITGDGGNDVAVFTGPLADYTFEVVANNLVVSDEIGDDGNDTIVGNTTETLRFGLQNVGLQVGTGGGNNLGGTAGVDILVGLAGNDTYTVNNVGDIVVEAPGAAGGVDTVNTTLTNYVLGENFENLSKTGGGAFTGTGNALANTITGNNGADTINGGGGNDILNGGGGNDVFVYTDAGFGADTINGFDAAPGGGQDLIDLSALGITSANFGTRVTIADVVDAGTDDTLVTVRDASNAVIGTISIQEVDGNDVTATDFILAGAAAPAPITGTAGGTTLNGTAGDDTISGLGGNDTINAAQGDDTINWNANTAPAATDGRDIVDGGTEGVAGDTFTITGNATAEAYTIYTRAAWDALAGNNLNSLNGATEIVITRNGTNFASVIAELREIEEIRINGADPNVDADGTEGGDTFTVVGDFSGTSLRPNTITIDGDAGNDTIDISSLGSDHRIVFKSNGGNDRIVGTLRAQDVIQFAAGTLAASYASTTNADGSTTLSDGQHAVTFTGTTPQLLDGAAPGTGTDTGTDTGTGGTPGGTPPTGSTVGVSLPGTADANVLIGTALDDSILGLGGDDSIIGNDGADLMDGGEGNDILIGQGGRDVGLGGAGDDRVFGGEGNDMLYGNAGADIMFGDGGDDLINAGAGDDFVHAGAGNDTIEASEGSDTYYGDEGSDTLVMAGPSNATVDLGTGFMGRGSASSGQTGSDTLWGFENVTTGSGQDVITASGAVNIIDGGGGSDTFRFLSAADANGDTLSTFQTGDKIDLSAIDANTGTANDQPFTLLAGSAPFTGAGQLSVSHVTREDGAYTVVSGNTTGADTPEFSLSIKGTHTLSATDFQL